MTHPAAIVCQQHYAAGKGCGRCPIQPECHSRRPSEPPQAWTDRCNAAAERHLKEQAA